MKLIGMIILITSSTAVGIALFLNQKRKCDICRELNKLCEYLLIDLEYKVTPINMLLDNSLENLDRLSFIQVSNINEGCMINSPLNKAENKELSSFLYSLGKSDINSQIKQIKGFQAYINQCENRYIKKYEGQRKLYLSFGFFFGVVISLVLV